MEYTLKNATMPLNEEYDVIVCGGGPSGCAAAISAAREGAKTLLLEASSVLGGMAAQGLVNVFTPMSDGIRCVYGGLAQKIVTEMKSHMKHVPEEKWDWVAIDYERLKAIYDRMVVESGAHLLFQTRVVAVEMKDDRNIDTIIVANKAGMSAYRAKVYIDCTGDADLYAWAGKPYEKGSEDGDLMPGTMCFIVSNMDEYEMPFMEKQYGGTRRATIKKILADGKYNIPDDHYVACKIGPRTYAFNAGHVWGIDCTDPESLTQGTLEGRRLARELHDAFREYSTAFAGSYLAQTAPVLGLRESRRIVGDYSFTADDYLARASFPDEVFRGKYYIDVHSRSSKGVSAADQKRKEEGKGGVGIVARYGHYGEGESYGVPYRCMCPRDLDNLLVAGRTICSDRVSNGSLRIMPACLCSGEAVGMAAKYASDMQNVNIHKVDTQLLRKRLMEEGAYLPKYDTDTF